jgi:hypothetical protein
MSSMFLSFASKPMISRVACTTASWYFNGFSSSYSSFTFSVNSLSESSSNKQMKDDVACLWNICAFNLVSTNTNKHFSSFIW